MNKVGNLVGRLEGVGTTLQDEADALRQRAGAYMAAVSFARDYDQHTVRPLLKERDKLLEERDALHRALHDANKEIAELKAKIAQADDGLEDDLEVYVEDLESHLRDAKSRIRRNCQALIEVVGANGPYDLEDAVSKAVEKINSLEFNEVRWRPVSDPPFAPGVYLVGSFSSGNFIVDVNSWNGKNWGRFNPTHWAVLPKGPDLSDEEVADGE